MRSAVAGRADRADQPLHAIRSVTLGTPETLKGRNSIRQLSLILALAQEFDLQLPPEGCAHHGLGLPLPVAIFLACSSTVAGRSAASGPTVCGRASCWASWRRNERGWRRNVVMCMT